MINDTYPPALRRMTERRDRFNANAARLDVWNITSNRHRARVGRWRRAASREAARVRNHPHWKRPVKSTTKWAELAEGPRPGLVHSCDMNGHFTFVGHFPFPE